MSLLLAGIGIALLTVPAAVVRSRVGPALKVRTASVAIVTGFAAVLAGLAFAAVPLLVRLHDGRASLEHQGALNHLSPAGPGAWLGAAVVAGGGFWLAGRSVVRSRRARRKARIPAWARHGPTGEVHGCDVVVAARSEPLAFAVPGSAPQIVLSQGLVDRLTPTETHAVACHEAAHIRLGHHRYLTLFNTYLVLWGLLPGAGSVVLGLRGAVEEWADEEALHALGADPLALRGALQNLGSVRALPTDRGGAQRGARRDGVAISCLIVTLVAAASYVTSHSFEEFAGVMAALH